MIVHRISNVFFIEQNNISVFVQAIDRTGYKVVFGDAKLQCFVAEWPQNRPAEATVASYSPEG